MKLKDQVCSLELARRLKELGDSQDSFFKWSYFTDDYYPSWEIVRVINTNNPNGYVVSDTEYSAFTVAELGEKLNNCASYKIGNRYHCIMFHVPGGYHQEAETEADARAKMRIYLLENTNRTKLDE